MKKILDHMKGSTKRGYTLLFAVLTAALVLGVAVFIVSISTKQFELSASVRNSMYSFYAADSGIECAALAFSNGQFATTSAAAMSCNGASLSGAYASISSGASDVPSVLLGSTYSTVYKALINAGFPGSTCADLAIYDGYNSAGSHYTVVDSRGYNHCVAVTNVPDTTLPNTVERALRMTKQG
jgi:hypothetical protein